MLKSIKRNATQKQIKNKSENQVQLNETIKGKSTLILKSIKNNPNQQHIHKTFENKITLTSM